MKRELHDREQYRRPVKGGEIDKRWWTNEDRKHLDQATEGGHLKKRIGTTFSCPTSFVENHRVPQVCVVSNNDRVPQVCPLLLKS